MADRSVVIRISAKDEFSGTFQTYNNNLKKAADETKNASRSSSDLSNTLKGLFTLAMVQRVGNYVGEMVNLGMEANATESRFRALTSTMGSYEDTMAGLRKATLGTTDDMHLQAGAMLLIQTTGIKTNAELERMMNLITMTKKPSEDMTTAIQNFGLMLANNSILRLDSFGISASKVRARIIELQETMGLDRSEAFRMAVLEEGEKNIAKFGDAAAAASTSLSRLGVVATNVFQDFAQDAASGAQGFALAIEYLLGLTDAQQAQAKQRIDEVATSLAIDFQEALDGAMSMGGVNEGLAGKFIKDALALSIEDPSLMADMDAFLERIFNDIGLDQRYRSQPIFADILSQTLQIQAANQSERDVAIEIANQQERQADALAQSATNQRMVLSFTDQLSDLNERNTREHIKQLEVEQQMAGIRAQYMGQLGESEQAAFSAAFSMNEQSAPGSSVPEYLTQNQADAVRSQADAVALLVDQMKALDEENEDLFTDEEIASAENYASKMDDLAGAAQDAADAFENMSLDEMLGRDGGGRLGEELDTVLEKMKELGAEAYQLQNAGDAFDLASGRETWMGKAFEDQIATTIAQSIMGGGMTEHMAAAILREFDAVMQGSQLRGVDVNNPQFQSMVTSTFTNPMFDPDTFNPDDFLAGFAPAADATDTMNSNLATIGMDSEKTGAAFELMADKAPVISEATGLMETSLGGAVTHADKLKTTFDEMSSKTYTLKIQPEMFNIPALLTILLPGLVQMVQAAGGVMPGTDTRASQSGSMVRMGQMG